MILPKLPLLTIAACCGLVVGCGSVSEAWRAYRDESTANNQMMLVRENPDTLGYRRLMAKSAGSADLRLFIHQKGQPDFLAEANSSDREYLIFYYLKHEQAFACRVKNERTGELEFAGPYRMSPGETKLLTAAKAQANKVLASR